MYIWRQVGLPFIDHRVLECWSSEVKHITMLSVISSERNTNIRAKFTEKNRRKSAYLNTVTRKCRHQFCRWSADRSIL